MLCLGALFECCGDRPSDFVTFPRYAYFGAIRDLLQPATMSYFSAGLLQDKSALEQCYKDLVSRFRQLPSLQEFCTFAESERLLFEAVAEQEAENPSSHTILKNSKHIPAAEFEKKPQAAGQDQSTSSGDLSDVPLPAPQQESRATHDTPHHLPLIGFADLLVGVRLKWFLRKFERNAIILFKMMFLYDSLSVHRCCLVCLSVLLIFLAVISRSGFMLNRLAMSAIPYWR